MLSALRFYKRRSRKQDFAPAPELSAFDLETLRLVRPYTMTSAARVQALILATRHVVRRGLPGAFVECGVWRGGSMLAAARTLLHAGDTSRQLYLYDTFDGMPPPEAVDVRHHDKATAAELLKDSRDDGTRAFASLDTVRRTMSQCDYNPAQLHYVIGRVEQTIPATMPERIAVLRLDTDWYASTRHELEHLFPALVPGGVLIVDDYGWWEGARRAVDEYFADRPMLLNVVDDTGRIGIKD